MSDDNNNNSKPLWVFGGLTLSAAAVAATLAVNGVFSPAPAPKPETPAVAEKAPAEPEAPPVTAEPAQQTALAPAAEQPKAEVPAEPPVPAAAPETPQKAEDRLPAFDTVRVEQSGEAIVAGTAAPGASVTVKLNGTDVGRAVANAEGAWVVVPEKPLQGTGVLTIDQKAPGSDKTVSSEQTVAVAVPEPAKGGEPMVALLDPEQPSKVLQAAGSAAPETPQPEATQPEPQAAAVEQPAATTAEPATEPAPKDLKVALGSVDYDDKGDIVFSGRAGAGATVRIYVDNQPVGDAISGADGKWSFTGRSEIAPGGHALRIDQIDGSGKVLNRIELPFMREEPERVIALSQSKAEAETAAATAEQPAASPAPAETVIAAAAPATVEETPKNGRIIIQPGNNLWKLSRVIYGKGVRYTVIYEANKDQIRNPNRIYPGQVFSTPNANPPEQIDPKRKVPLTEAEGGSSAN
jgi:hypothetical protein